MPEFCAPKPATETALRETEARLVRLIRELNARFDSIEVRINALHLHSTCHPEWVAPGAGAGAKARRASIVEAVLLMSGSVGMTVPELAGYLHIPVSRRETLGEDLSYLVAEERIQIVPSRNKRWRIRSHGTKSNRDNR